MYQANEKRYETMKYHRCGASGLMLPELSLGLWHNFGDTGVYENMKQMCFTAFDNGITHFDLANNYGPQPGSAEANFGKILREEFSAYRDELIISTKAGYDMWPGPYGNWGSRKYLIASLDQSLKRLGLDYVDIFYHHRMDPETPCYQRLDAVLSLLIAGNGERQIRYCDRSPRSARFPCPRTTRKVYAWRCQPLSLHHPYSHS